MEQIMSTLKLPTINSVSELADFWDNHDLTDFEEQLEEVVEPVFERKAETIVEIRLPSNYITAIRKVATSKGVGQATLIQQWVFERLQLAGAV